MENKQKKLFIGITGGIGSGKSLFTKYLEDKGEIVFQADLIAKELMQNHRTVKKHVIELLGQRSFTPEGKINSGYISEIVFSDVKKLQKLNSIVHSNTIIEILRRGQKELKTRNLVFVEAALIFESDFDEKLDYNILLKSDISIRLNRVLERDNTTSDEFFKRAQFQIDPDVAEKLSDFTIINNGDLESLNKKFDFIYRLLKTLTY